MSKLVHKDLVKLTIDVPDGGEPRPREAEQLVRAFVRLTDSVARDLARKEGRKLPPGFDSGYALKPHNYDAPVPKGRVGEIPAPGSKWVSRGSGRVIRVLASGPIGNVCATGHLWAMEAQAIWPDGWPERARIVVYNVVGERGKGAWAYVQNFVEHHERRRP